MHVLHQLPKIPRDPNLLVGTGTADDAGVYKLDRNRALVQTVDFFTPIVDDPFVYGQIAAANAFSDVYAMGGRPFTALNLLGIPTDAVPPHVIARILRGGLAKAQEARCTIVGGHSMQNPEPIYGMAVTGIVSPRRMITNADARPKDLLVLTKPLGTGIITTAIKRGIATATLARCAIQQMTLLNSVGADLAERALVRAGTDITGFGLIGHLGSLCEASQVSAVLYTQALPAIAARDKAGARPKDGQGTELRKLVRNDCIPGGSRQNFQTADTFTDWGSADAFEKHLMTDAQTSGGLLLCVAPNNLRRVLAHLKRAGTPCAAIIGHLTRPAPARIRAVKAPEQS